MKWVYIEIYIYIYIERKKENKIQPSAFAEKAKKAKRRNTRQLAMITTERDRTQGMNCYSIMDTIYIVLFLNKPV